MNTSKIQMGTYVSKTDAMQKGEGVRKEKEFIHFKKGFSQAP